MKLFIAWEYNHVCDSHGEEATYREISIVAVAKDFDEFKKLLTDSKLEYDDTMIEEIDIPEKADILTGRI